MCKTKQQNETARGRGDWQGMNWIRKDLRLAIYLRDGMACMYCGSGIEDGALELDHVQPASKGGSNTADNLVTCCKKCNSSRGNRSVKTFAKAAAQYVNHGAKAADILAAIDEHTATPIKPFRAEAKEILARRPKWQEALTEANS